MNDVNNANECTLLIDDKVYAGWTAIEVQRGIERIAGGYVLQLTTRYPGVDAPLQLRQGLQGAAGR